MGITHNIHIIEYTGLRKKVYNEENVWKAVHDIANGKLSYSKASAKYGVPKTTLHRRFTGGLLKTNREVKGRLEKNNQSQIF
ncbi:hypothetical protein HHI36_012680 [Cryptolaemus montrouzieri]|uniref:HTH psq-type domain-containing protein n=1 Tax=Cryptolaemus montrouzieri TaxID=559131 RepID=A0ABD2NFI4_9CUCU